MANTTGATESNRLSSWIASRRANGTEGQPVIYIPPEQNVLCNLRTIMSYLGINSPVTFYQWVELYGLPAVKRPDDGRWMTTMTAIDQWIFMACEADNMARRGTRGTNHRLTTAARRLNERIASQQEAPKADDAPG